MGSVRSSVPLPVGTTLPPDSVKLTVTFASAWPTSNERPNAAATALVLNLGLIAPQPQNSVRPIWAHVNSRRMLPDWKQGQRALSQGSELGLAGIVELSKS